MDYKSEDYNQNNAKQNKIEKNHWSCFFEKIDKTGKPLARLNKKQKRERRRKLPKSGMKEKI